MIQADYRLVAIADLDMIPALRVPELARAASDGGATMIQIRAKRATADTFLSVVDATITALSGVGVPVIVNDRADVAGLSGARGIHLGDADLDPASVRALIPGALIGRTVREPRGAERAARAGADYLGVGSVYGSVTKPAAQTIGLDGLERVTRSSTRPVVAIGGIDARNAAACIAAGARGVAVVSAIFRDGETVAPDEVRARASRLRAVIGAAGRHA